MQVCVGVRFRLGSGSMSNNFEFFEEELNTGAGWGLGQRLGLGLVTHSQHQIKAEVNIN